MPVNPSAFGRLFYLTRRVARAWSPVPFISGGVLSQWKERRLICPILLGTPTPCGYGWRPFGRQSGGGRIVVALPRVGYCAAGEREPSLCASVPFVPARRPSFC